MFPTPNMNHLTLEDKDVIYEPAEDSFLLLDALEKDAHLLKKLRPVICLEIGCGSGVVITFLAQLLGSGTAYFCTDINPHATLVTNKTAMLNEVLVHPILTDLVSAFDPRIYKNIDVLIFNPPYVVTPLEELGISSLSASWAGGQRGRQVMDRLFPLIPLLLSEEGIFYLVVIKENDPDEIKHMMKEFGYHMTIVMTRRSGPEYLSVLRFAKTQHYD